jgi:hypothetical protein
MKCQNSCGPRLGKLVHQLPRVVTFAYDLCFRHMIAHWKGITERRIISSWPRLVLQSVTWAPNPKKTSFRASKQPQKFGTQKTVEKLPRWKTIFRASGIGGWPPISTCINPPSLGRNGLHCIDFPHQDEEIYAEFGPSEPLSLVQELPCFDNSIKLDPLLSSALDLCVHNMITGWMLYAVRVELYWCQLFCYF